MSPLRPHNLTIGFVRRAFSFGGGAETYLERLAAGVTERGYQVRLYASARWPASQWRFGPVSHVKGRSAIAFANEVRKVVKLHSATKKSSGSGCDILMSLERIWRCDVYRAGDGVHRSWLERRRAVEGRLQQLGRFLNPKHSAAITLETSLFADSGAGRVIANSRMVREEIARFYRYPRDRIDLVYNGVPVDRFRPDPKSRQTARETLGLKDDEIAVLFAGTGWGRKGLRFAIKAIEASGKGMRLFVAGRGNKRTYRSSRVQFLDLVRDMPALYGAADIFLLPTIYDPFSNACLEALAAGLPVLTTTANGFSEIIENRVHGSVIDDPREIDTIREELRFWADSDRREKARVSNVVLAEKFDISVNVAKTLEILISTTNEQQ